MQELESRNDTIMYDEDKGGSVVILDVDNYVKETERQLNKKRKLQENKLRLYYKY